MGTLTIVSRIADVDCFTRLSMKVGIHGIEQSAVNVEDDVLIIHTVAIIYLRKGTGIRQNNSQTTLKITYRHLCLDILFLAKSNFLTNTTKICRRNLQIGSKIFERNFLQYIRTASYQLQIPFFWRLPIGIEVSVMSLPK